MFSQRLAEVLSEKATRKLKFKVCESLLKADRQLQIGSLKTF